MIDDGPDAGSEADPQVHAVGNGPLVGEAQVVVAGAHGAAYAENEQPSFVEPIGVPLGGGPVCAERDPDPEGPPEDQLQGRQGLSPYLLFKNKAVRALKESVGGRVVTANEMSVVVAHAQHRWEQVDQDHHR